MSSSDCSFDGTCAAPGDGGTGSETSSGGYGDGYIGDGAVEAAAPPANCDANADPKDPTALPCVDDNFALFVNVSASPGGDGTKEHPLTKINDALAKVGAKRRIYVCGTDTYPEHLEVNAANAAWLIGGFDCTTWQPATGTKANVAPSDPGYALHVDTVSSDFRINDLAFEAIAGTTDNPSSIAVFVANSPNVTFTRVNITAHDGAKGADGVAGTTGTSNPLDGTGNAGTATLGGAAKTCLCSTGDTTVGGKGGDTAAATHDGTGGLPAVQPSSPPTATGTPGTNEECNGGSATGAAGGSAGHDGKDAIGPTVLGALDLAGWHPTRADAGESGGVGQGGGGGGSLTVGSTTDTGGGGGGGCGGCGGGGGTGGTGGGASVGLLAFDAPVKLVACAIMASKGGAGGAGMGGASGASGGGRGSGFQQACVGGKGGAGGLGGAGAGGPGGVAAGALFVGSGPSADAATTITGAAHGAGGLGGKPTQNDGPPGLDGKIIAAP